MSGSVQRWKSAVLLGAAFTLGICAIWLAGETLPVYGDLIRDAMYFGAPLTWLLIKTKVFGATSGTLVLLATLAPYPLIGMIAGYGWPLDFSAKTRMIRPMVQRFVITGLVLGIVSFLLGLWVMPGAV
jgi:hypothetical protein